MDLVFEIGCEDLPARFVNPLLEQLQQNFLEQCVNNRIDVSGARTVGTPRRLTLLVDDLADKQADLSEERTGPPANVGFKDGEPTKAAEGFARGQGADVEDLYIVNTERGEYVAVKVFEEGKPTRELLVGILHDVMNSFNFPKSMRWATYSTSFGRPVRWIVAVAGGEVVPVSFANVDAGNTTLGHRFWPAPGHDEAPSKLLVTDVREYLDLLGAAGVVVDPEKRRDEVEELIIETAKQVGGAPVDDPELVDEVTNLVEQPHAVLVQYDESYLELPDEVLISSMRSHQRYFGILDDDGNLTNACAVVYNTPVRDPNVVAEGNLRVLKARLDDAKFFWNQDLQKTLAEYLPALDDVLWLKQLGSMLDKSKRVSQLAMEIGAEVGFGHDVCSAAERAGELCKCDLVTQMVYEFPDLQGTMGREYALRSDESEDVAVAIYEQYLPRGADDDLPQTDAGACVALAEKLDSLVGCFLVDLIPSSTSDPYGLRRAAIGVIRILQDRGWTVSIDRLVELAAEVYGGVEEIEIEWTVDNRAALLEFITTRLEHQLSADHPTDIVRAVLAVGLADVTTVTDRVEALSKLRDEPVFEPLAAGFKRVVNILKKEGLEPDAEPVAVDEALFEHNEENQLWNASRDAAIQIEDAIAKRDWMTAVRELADLREPVDAFFDNVMVNAEDPDIRSNRLSLLFDLQLLFRQVADLSVVS